MLRYPSVTVTAFSAPFDDDSVALVRAEFRHHTKFGRRLHVIDLEQIGTPDSRVFRALIHALRETRQVGGDVRLVSAQPGLRRVLELTGLTRVFAVHSNVKDAVMSFREQPLRAS